MDRPEVDLESISFGKIFQISPEGKDPIQMSNGGDFLISCGYSDKGVLGYLALVHEVPRISRIRGLSYQMVEWKHLECVGSVHWFKQEKEFEDSCASSSIDSVSQ